MYEIFKDKIFVGALKTMKSKKILVHESFRLYGIDGLWKNTYDAYHLRQHAYVSAILLENIERETFDRSLAKLQIHQYFPHTHKNLSLKISYNFSQLN